ncbi:alpha-glucosidase [Izhakiella capsodis]|uniref:Alpha-glucosidase n=1 Tax=Izhakiella capsodis TaxID=1367852 RepID=A0A1I4W0R1_9GAMM|nr:glycoside hydrolase family 31 protein [Izhakiella capsodis]SFN07168.1 alpha-glucosidase [Izhakiella capsodis]
MKKLKKWELKNKGSHKIEILVEDKHIFYISVLDEKLFRVNVKVNGESSLDRTWSIDPSNDIPWEGRLRDDYSGFELPEFTLEEFDDHLIISTNLMRVTVHQPLWLEWSYRNDANDSWSFLTKDRTTSAYLLDTQGNGAAHYQSRYKDERYYGLGEKTGPLLRNGNRYEMRNLDAMGYNAFSTDPLYKHVPFIITQRENISFGIFYDNLSSCWIDLGNELDNYHKPYRRWQSESGDIDYYIFSGSKILDITKRFVRLTGKTIFGPKWSLGYSGSTMHYTDAPDAQQQLLKFIELCEKHAIPCDSFQLSSGYTSIKDKRYVFNWNYDKVPNPKLMTKSFHDAGFKLAANIKPCLLQDHPRYQEVADNSLFIIDSEENKPEISCFWDDEGSHLDFTNPATIFWWKSNVKTQLLDMGIDSTWNDNNEYEVWDGEARCFGFGKPIAIKHIRPVMPLLMMRASMEAQIESSPEKRPYLISRSGCAGMQRYVQTWSGDNRTNWDTLRYNIRMGLGMSLSGLFNVGHDVGGFSGDRPDAELFVRWVQNGVMHPRFTIHSWNDDKTVNEPWMYPSVIDSIRSAIQLRYRIMPYLYTLLWQAHSDDEPILRPTFLDHQYDEQTFAECDEFLLGRDLLVASVVEPNARTRSLWLPENDHGWYEYDSETWYSGGQWVNVDAPLEKLPLFVRAGSGIPVSAYLQSVNPHLDNSRELLLFPTLGQSTSNGVIFEDDGESWGYLKNNARWINWRLEVTPRKLSLSISSRGDYIPSWKEIIVTLPKKEKRPLYINGTLSHQWKLN